MTLHCERPDSMLHIINLFKELREIAHKRLNTTVEEDRRAQVLLSMSNSAVLQATCHHTTVHHTSMALRPESGG